MAKVPIPAQGAYLGANTDPDDNLDAGFRYIEQALGKPMAIRHQQYSDQYEIVDLGRPEDPIEAMHADHGVIPMLSVHSVDRSLSEIAGNALAPGDHRKDPRVPRQLLPDDFYRRLADSFKAYGKPAFLRWNAEMNQPWNDYCSNVVFNPLRHFRCRDPDSGRQQRPQDYVAAWRHIHDLFQQEGALNVSWVWCPAADANGSDVPGLDGLRALYPGDAYVDWTCLDGYNWSPPNTWRSFREVFGGYYAALLRVAPDKPVMIGEFNSNDGGDDSGWRKAAWLADAYASANTFPRIKALVLFNVYDHANHTDWRLQKYPPVLDAVRRAIADGYFLSAEAAP
jgi:hypothetical protein